MPRKTKGNSMQDKWILVTDDAGAIAAHGEHGTLDEVLADIDDMTNFAGYVFTWHDSLSGTVFEPSSGATVDFRIERGSDLPPNPPPMPATTTATHKEKGNRR